MNLSQPESQLRFNDSTTHYHTEKTYDGARRPGQVLDHSVSLVY